MLRLKYFEPSQEKRERWLVSYVDVMTILLILFIAVAAQAVQRGVQSSPQPRAAKTEPARAPRPDSVSPAVMAVKQQLERRGLDLKIENSALIISLPQAILFPPGQDEITPGAQPIIGHIAGLLRGIPNRVALVGHADSTPIHSHRFRNNWELSAARSLKLLDLLTTRYGIPEERLSIASRGSYAPKQSNDTVEGRAENRRVEIVILGDASGVGIGAESARAGM